MLLTNTTNYELTTKDYTSFSFIRNHFSPSLFRGALVPSAVAATATLSHAKRYPLFKHSVGVAGVVAAKVTFVLLQNLFAEALIISATV